MSENKKVLTKKNKKTGPRSEPTVHSLASKSAQENAEATPEERREERESKNTIQEDEKVLPSKVHSPCVIDKPSEMQQEPFTTQHKSHQKNGEVSLHDTSFKEESELPPEVRPKIELILPQAVHVREPGEAVSLQQPDPPAQIHINDVLDQLSRERDNSESLRETIKQQAYLIDGLRVEKEELQQVWQADFGRLQNNYHLLQQSNSRSATQASEQSTRSQKAITHLNVEISKANGLIYNYQQAQQKAEADLKNMQHHLNEARNAAEESRRQIQSKDEALREAQDDIQGLKRRVQTQEASVTKAQEAAVTLLSSTLSISLPDDAIRRQFRELFESLQDWARDNSVRENDVFQTTDILNELNRRKLLRASEKWHYDHMFQLDSTAPDTLLNAAMADRICRTLFNSPFFFADFTHLIDVRPATPAIDDLGPKAGAKMMLDAILHLLLRGNYNEAQIWRARTVEVLSRGPDFEKNVRRCCEDVIDRFVERYKPLLQDGLEDVEERSRLLDIIEDFAKLAIKLWSQNSVIRWFSTEYFHHKRFEVDSDEMEAARAVKLDEHDTSLNDRPIPVIVQPLVMAFGDAEGKDYSKHKIWSKAVVWVSNKNRPEPKRLQNKKNGSGTSGLGQYVPDALNALNPWAGKQ